MAANTHSFFFGLFDLEDLIRIFLASTNACLPTEP